MLLQGPVGPFFKELQEKICDAGYSVKRALFNSGDDLFASGQSCVRFTGTLDAWKSWIQFEILQKRNIVQKLHDITVAPSVARAVVK